MLDLLEKFHPNSQPDNQYGMFDFRAPDGYLYLTLCAPGTRRFIPNVVLHQHKIAFCAPIRAPSTNAVRWTCPAHAPFIPYWPDNHIHDCVPLTFWRFECLKSQEHLDFSRTNTGQHGFLRSVLLLQKTKSVRPQNSNWKINIIREI